MMPLIGLTLVMVCVFGTYIAVGGKIEIIMHAAPHEMCTIMGAAIGAMIVGNKPVILKKLMKTLKMAASGSKLHAHEYKDLLCCLFLLCKLMKSKGFIALEAHVENPVESSIFKQFPSVLGQQFALDLICDTLRTVSMGIENPLHIEDVIGKKLDKFHHERAAPAHTLQTMADGLPAIGIVAAVLGVIKTMASIDQPPTVLGAMIGGALVGTFLGVFLAYCIVGPLAVKSMQVIDEEQQFFFVIRDVLVSHLNGAAPQVSMEMGRANVPSYYQPTFIEMEQATGELKAE